MAIRSARNVLVLLPALGLFLTAGCAESVDPGADTAADDEVTLVNEGTLTGCTNLPYEPFEFEQDGETVGFDIDLLGLVATDLDVELDVSDTSFEGIESGKAFDSGQCDIAAAAISITDERSEVMDFSDGYFDANQALAVHTDSQVEEMVDLEDKVLGVQEGTTGEQYAEEHEDEYGYTIQQYEDLGLLETAVRTKDVHAGINDNSVLYVMVDDHDDVEITDEFETGEEYGIAVRDGDNALRARVNEVLDTARENGQYAAHYEEWFGRKPDERTDRE